jgi:hypothetical protein
MLSSEDSTPTPWMNEANEISSRRTRMKFFELKVVDLIELFVFHKWVFCFLFQILASFHSSRRISYGYYIWPPVCSTLKSFLWDL